MPQRELNHPRRPIRFNTTLEDYNEQESSEMFTRFSSNAFVNAEKEHTVENSSIERQRRIIVEKPAPIERPKKAVVERKKVDGKSRESAETDIATEKIQKLKKHFQMDNLITKCIQPSLRLVKDPPSNPSKAINRLNILMNWLKNKKGKIQGIYIAHFLRNKQRNTF